MSLIVSAFATLADVRGTLTPQLDAEQDSTLVLIDLGKGQTRMGGSILAQVLDQAGGAVPDLDDAQDLIQLVNAVNALRAARSRCSKPTPRCPAARAAPRRWRRWECF